MNPLEIIGTALVGLVVIPILAYMVMKFGAAGFYRAKRKWKDKNDL